MESKEIKMTEKKKIQVKIQETVGNDVVESSGCGADEEAGDHLWSIIRCDHVSAPDARMRSFLRCCR